MYTSQGGYIGTLEMRARSVACMSVDKRKSCMSQAEGVTFLIPSKVKEGHHSGV